MNMRNVAWIAGFLGLIGLVVALVAVNRAGNVAGSVFDLQERVESLSNDISGLDDAVDGIAERLERGPDTVGGTSIPFATAAELSDEELATIFFRLVNAEVYPYAWNYEPEPPAGFYTSSNPAHGAILRAFMNDIAFDAVQRTAGSFPPGSIIVKENHVPGDLEVPTGALEPVPDFPGNLDSVTIMVKLEGYNPDAGDWFWSKHQPDGSIDAAGKPAGCIGCHQQVEDNDWVFDADVTGGGG